METPISSSEDHCNLVKLPHMYRKSNPSKPTGQNSTSLDIHTQIELINFDFIDTVNMVVTLTLEVSMKRHDSRLTFSNPMMNQSNSVLSENYRFLWLPLENVVHQNAIIGELNLDNDIKVDVIANNPRTIDAEMAVEDRLFDGSKNALRATLIMKITYHCIFDVRKFPFDKEKRNIIMQINQSSRVHKIEFSCGRACNLQWRV